MYISFANMLESTEVSAVPAEVFDAKTCVQIDFLCVLLRLWCPWRLQPGHHCLWPVRESITGFCGGVGTPSTVDAKTSVEESPFAVQKRLRLLSASRVPRRTCWTSPAACRRSLLVVLSFSVVRVDDRADLPHLARLLLLLGLSSCFPVSSEELVR